MQHARRETSEKSEKLQTMLGKYIARISDELQQLALNGDWEAIRSVFRVLDAHARAKELRAQGQPARAHLWLVGVGRKRQKAKITKKTTPPQPAA
jgi:HPt (histidine-containing phosphotransfer) domain-containing protein